MNYSEWQEIATQAQLGVVRHTMQLDSHDDASSWQLTTDQGQYFVRTTLARYLPWLVIEAQNLNALQNTHSLACTRTIAHGKTVKTAWLIGQWETLTPQGSLGKFAQQLAALHRQQHAEHQYGWHHPNIINNTPQTNHWLADWTSFYRSQRLLPQVHHAKANGLATKMIDALYHGLAQLDDILANYHPTASFIHGNLRSQHCSYQSTGHPFVTHPACAYADREMDLAALSLANSTVYETILTHYQAEYPLLPGHEQRLVWYQLYYALLDFNQYGSASLAPLQKLTQIVTRA